MNLPILIVGYERSGTTMLRRLVSMHPALEYDLIHEKPRLLMNATSTEHALKTMVHGVSSIRSGQKIPYTVGTGVKVFIDKFLRLFPNGYIMHIIREPLETINSQVNKFNRRADKCIKNYFNSVPTIYNYTRGLPNSCQISYENLVSSPKEVLADIYRWMGQEVDPAHIDRVITTQESWKYNGRDMPGLRYFDRIMPKERTIILKKKHADAIRSRPSLSLKTDF